MINTDQTKAFDATQIESGMIVAYRVPGEDHEGHFRVRRVTKHTVNLGAIFGNRLYYRSVPKDQVREDEAAWYQYWQSTDSYQCM